MSDLNISIADSGAPQRRAPDQGQRCCLECGKAFTARRKVSLYCSAKCRSDWSNRRNMRGAILYDLKMAERFERDDAKDASVLSIMNRLCADWRDEDNRRRSGRKSWGDWKSWLLDRPYLYADRLVKKWAGRQSAAKPKEAENGR